LVTYTCDIRPHALWGQNIHHRSISPDNPMVYKTSNGRYNGVLIDFDFSLSPSGQECAGTVPFMAIELLTQEAIEGQAKHLYRHDAESFIWVLTWVCLRYEDGKLLCMGRPLDKWLKVDINTCREKKSDFLYHTRYKAQPSSSHTGSWSIVQSSLDLVSLSYVRDRGTSLSDTIVFEI
jgi:serine/threonine protein kinase